MARGYTLCIALGLAAAGCSDDGSAAAPTTTTVDDTTTTSSATTVPERLSSTTTTAFDPASVEGAVEAAYLKSWDVYATAVYDLELDERALAEVYAGEHLQTKVNEIKRRIDEEQAALVNIDHDYTIQFVDDSTAIVIDRYQNHQVLIDPVSKEPTEEDPDEMINDVVTVKLISGTWKVSLKEHVGQ